MTPEETSVLELGMTEVYHLTHLKTIWLKNCKGSVAQTVYVEQNENKVTPVVHQFKSRDYQSHGDYSTH